MSTAWGNRWLAINFAVTIFVSAFLLFQVQPLVSKYILPWFGGSPAVWTTCMLFFQTLLFGGYAYAHLSQRFLPPRAQALVHLGLIVAALLLLRVVPSESWKPEDSSDPIGHILLLLSASIGLPYFVLSSTGPLIQAWFARSFPGRIPYRLYALSNLGSLLALLSYPFLFERMWDVPQQAGFWSWGFVAYAALCTYAAISVWMLVRGAAAGGASASTEGEAAGLELAPVADANAADETWLRRLLWLALPAFASLTLLATTNHVTTDVAPVPFLWVVPLSLYLLTFIIAFDHSRWYRPAWIAGFTLLAVYLASAAYFNGSKVDLYECGIPGKVIHFVADRWARWRGVEAEQIHESLQLNLGYLRSVAISFAAMFGICMLCHGELVRLRPHPRHLTAFFLMIAAGGALGGASATLLAPVVFRTYYEFDLSFMGGYLLAIVILTRSVRRFASGVDTQTGQPQWVAAVAGLLLLVLAGIGLCDLPQYFDESSSRRQLAVRNFFGTLSVLKQDSDNIGGVVYTLRHGGITHGIQFSDERRNKPTTYYSEDSGVGRTIGYFRQHAGSLNVGAVGLGTGTLAAYVDKGDSICFYEINPAVVEISEPGNWFTYLEDCKDRGGQYQIKLGDARLVLERELKEKNPHKFQVLVLDAFSGDAIPVHLLTEEAFRTYLAHLADDGAIAVHISNRFLDLEPVVRGAGEKFNLRQVRIKNANDSHNAIMASDWIILTRNEKLAAALQADAVKPGENPPPAVIWTDARSNLFDLLK